MPTIIDVYPVGHCMYGCQSCAYAYTHCLPITFTNYIRTKEKNMIMEKNFEILICPSYSFVNSPCSLLSNSDIVQYILRLNYSHAIKLHPLAYEYIHNKTHPLLTLTELEKKNVEKLYQSKTILLNEEVNVLKLIEHARVIICDSNSSIPFETLYFQDKKYIFVYETEDIYDEHDDRQVFFHKFQNVEQLNSLVEDYFNHQLECKTEHSHEYFLEKYDEPDGNEIEKLIHLRQWLTTNENESLDTNTDEQNDKDKSCDSNINEQNNEIDPSDIYQIIQKVIRDEFSSISSPIVPYALGDELNLI